MVYNKKFLAALLLLFLVVAIFLSQSSEESIVKIASAVLLAFAVLMLVHILLKKAVNLFTDPKIIDKSKITLASMYLLNFSFIYRFYPNLVTGDGNLSTITYLWAWATLSVFFYLSPELKKLFYIKGKKGEKAPAPNLFTLVAQIFLYIGVLPAIILIVYSDAFLILEKLT